MTLFSVIPIGGCLLQKARGRNFLGTGVSVKYVSKPRCAIAPESRAGSADGDESAVGTGGVQRLLASLILLEPVNSKADTWLGPACLKDFCKLLQENEFFLLHRLHSGILSSWEPAAHPGGAP